MQNVMSEVNRQRQNRTEMKKATKRQHTLYMKLIVTDKVMFSYKKVNWHRQNQVSLRKTSPNCKTKP